MRGARSREIFTEGAIRGFDLDGDVGRKHLYRLGDGGHARHDQLGAARDFCLERLRLLCVARRRPTTGNRVRG